MKKILLLFSALFIVNFAFSQSVNGVDIKDLDADYIMIRGSGTMFSSKLTIDIDFGQAVKYSGKENDLLDEKGKKIVLNSMVDALNLMSAVGYELHTVYVMETNIVYYILKKNRTLCLEEENLTDEDIEWDFDM